ncbi:hypothetical protein HDV05_001336 [Chytridiales sp. JEL 0842]|nr:hypothetical protein HDV05_001336 [Chytridiales sp. JEL 0842]
MQSSHRIHNRHFSKFTAAKKSLSDTLDSTSQAMSPALRFRQASNDTAKSAANAPLPPSQAADPTTDNAATSTATAPSSAADPPSTNETVDDADEVTEINNEYVMLPRKESVGNRWTAFKISKAAPSSQAAAKVKQTQKQKQTPEQDLAAFAKKNSAKKAPDNYDLLMGNHLLASSKISKNPVSYRNTANLCHFDVVLESVFAALGLTENYKQLLLNTYHLCLAYSEQSLGAQILAHFLDRARVSTRRSSPMPRRQKTSNTFADADNLVDLGDIKASAAAAKEITATRMQATLNTLADFMHTAKEKCHVYGFKKGVFGDPNASLRSVIALASCSDPTVLTPKTFPASTDFQTLSWQHPLAEMFVMRTGMIYTVCEDCTVLTRDPILDIPVHFKGTFQQFLEKLPVPTCGRFIIDFKSIQMGSKTSKIASPVARSAAAAASRTKPQASASVPPPSSSSSAPIPPSAAAGGAKMPDPREQDKQILEHYAAMQFTIKSKKADIGYDKNNEMLTILRKRREASDASAQSSSPYPELALGPTLPPGKAEVKDLEDFFYIRKTIPLRSTESIEAAASQVKELLKSPVAARLKLKEEDARLLLLYTNVPEKQIIMSTEGTTERGHWVEDLSKGSLSA